MPLTMVNAGEPSVIRKVGGREETRRSEERRVVNVKDSRVAIGKDMANKIMVC